MSQDQLCILYSHFLKNNQVGAKIFIESISDLKDIKNTNLGKENHLRIFHSHTLFSPERVINLEFQDKLEIISVKKCLYQAMARN